MALPRRSAVFIADAQGLDFLNSVRPSGDGQIDWLENGAALLSWLEQAALEPLESIQRLRGHSDRKSTRLNSSHQHRSRMPSSA